MEHLSYIELNVVCIILLGIVLFRQFNNRSIISSSKIYMNCLILTSCVLCVSDIFAIMFRGQTFSGARILIELSNLIYLESMPIISMFWLKYVLVKTGKKISKSKNVLLIIPIILFTIIAVSNPFTQMLFSIDQNNLYARGPGIFLHWIISWFYLLLAGIISYRAYKLAQSWNKKSQYRPLLIFIIFPAIGCFIQMLIYGISVVQAGIALSIVLINFQNQDNRISMDELTGINNRREMNTYVDRIINRYKSVQLNIFMIDINNFKKINDTFGHTSGDEALLDVATALKKVCENSADPLFLCRYGGDEFVIISRDIDEVHLEDIKSLLQSEIRNTSAATNRPYKLSISIGFAVGICESMADFENLINKADEAMYIEKEAFKASF